MLFSFFSRDDKTTIIHIFCTYTYTAVQVLSLFSRKQFHFPHNVACVHDTLHLPLVHRLEAVEATYLIHSPKSLLLARKCRNMALTFRSLHCILPCLENQSTI